MSLKRLVHILIVFAFGAGFTGLTYFVQKQAQDTSRIENSLKLARQVGAQAEALWLEARQRGESDPAAWAAQHLTQGTEPRPIKVTKFLADAGHPSSQGGESFRLDPDGAFFEFVKIFIPEQGIGIKVAFDLEYWGFLGTKGRLGNDFAVFFTFVFASILSSLFISWTRRNQLEHLVAKETRKRLENLPDQPEFVEENTGSIKVNENEKISREIPNATLGTMGTGLLQGKVRNWVKDAKATVTALGGSIKDLVRGARDLATAASNSRNALSEFREKLHQDINGVEDGKSALREVEEAAVRCEVFALNLVIESARLGEGGKHFTQTAEQLHKLVQNIRKSNQKSEGILAHVDSQLAPLATDVDLVFQAYEEVFQAVAGMDGPIKKTSEGLMGQARLIQTLSQDVESESSAPKKLSA